jgi:hypothetical protein
MYKKSAKKENDSFHENHFAKPKNDGRKTDKNLSLRRLE